MNFHNLAFQIQIPLLKQLHITEPIQMNNYFLLQWEVNFELKQILDRASC